MRTEFELLLIGIGGATGAIFRFGIAELAKRFSTSPFPWGWEADKPKRVSHFAWASVLDSSEH